MCSIYAHHFGEPRARSGQKEHKEIADRRQEKSGKLRKTIEEWRYFAYALYCKWRRIFALIKRLSRHSCATQWFVTLYLVVFNFEAFIPMFYSRSSFVFQISYLRCLLKEKRNFIESSKLGIVFPVMKVVDWSNSMCRITIYSSICIGYK